jgi:hypothetical protein
LGAWWIDWGKEPVAERDAAEKGTRISLISGFMSPDCLNCGTPLLAGQHFCAQCGQKAETHRISLHEITHDAVHYFTHADKGIFHLLKGLITRPGIVAREYIDGKRKSWFKPLNFFLIVIGVVVFMTSSLHKEYPRPASRPSVAQAQRPDPATMERYRAMGLRAANSSRFTAKYSNMISMLATPLFAGFFWLFYRRARYNYLEHLVANLYFVPMVMLLYGLVVIPIQRVSGSYNVFMMALGFFFLWEIIYRALAYYQFIGKKGGWQLFKSFAVSLLASAFWIAISYGLVWYYIRYGF